MKVTTRKYNNTYSVFVEYDGVKELIKTTESKEDANRVAKYWERKIRNKIKK